MFVMIQTFLAAFLRPLIYTIVVAGLSIRVYKTMLRNNWTFWQFVVQRRYRFLMAACFIVFSLAFGIYQLQHPL